MGQFSMEFVLSVDSEYERDLEVGMDGLIGEIKGCVCDLSEDFGLEGLDFCEIGGFCRPLQLCSISPNGLQQ